MLVLDNLETPWEADPLAIEARISQLAAIHGLTLLVSFRGDEHVGGARWSPRHPVAPLSDPDARALFLEIAGAAKSNDPDLPAFLEALGGVPLAICLTARRAARHPTLAGLWEQWGRLGPEMASLTTGTRHRLSSVTHSIALSLGSSRMTPDAHRLFAILGQCPAGLARSDRIALLGDAAFAAEEALRGTGLAHLRPDHRLDLLPPVRDHARRSCRPETDIQMRRDAHWADLVIWFEVIHANSALWRRNIFKLLSISVYLLLVQLSPIVWITVLETVQSVRIVFPSVVFIVKRLQVFQNR